MQRVRLQADGVAAAVESVQAAACGRTSISWVGDASTPIDLGERLQAIGLERLHELTALALDGAPAGSPAYQARPCVSLEEYAAAQELDWHVNGRAETTRAELRSRLADAWRREGRRGRSFVVVENGVVVAVGRARRLHVARARQVERRSRARYPVPRHAGGRQLRAVSASTGSAPSRSTPS